MLVSSAMEPDQSESGLAGFWSAAAGDYDRAYDAATREGLRARQAAVVHMLGDVPGDVVDAGMGPGRLLADLHSQGWQVAGVDLSRGMVEAARARLPAAAARLREGSIEQLPFEAATFDAAVATGVLEYVDFRVGALRELARVLRPGGVAVVSVPNPLGPREALNWVVLYPLARRLKRIVPLGRPAPPRRPWPPGRGRFTRRLAEAGMTVDEVAYVNPRIVPAPFDRLFPAAAARSGAWIERRRPRLSRVLATQVVYKARLVAGHAHRPTR